MIYLADDVSRLSGGRRDDERLACFGRAHLHQGEVRGEPWHSQHSETCGFRKTARRVELPGQTLDGAHCRTIFTALRRRRWGLDHGVRLPSQVAVHQLECPFIFQYSPSDDAHSIPSPCCSPSFCSPRLAQPVAREGRRPRSSRSPCTAWKILAIVQTTE